MPKGQRDNAHARAGTNSSRSSGGRFACPCSYNCFSSNSRETHTSANRSEEQFGAIQPLDLWKSDVPTPDIGGPPCALQQQHGRRKKGLWTSSLFFVRLTACSSDTKLVWSFGTTRAASNDKRNTCRSSRGHGFALRQRRGSSRVGRGARWRRRGGPRGGYVAATSRLRRATWRPRGGYVGATWRPRGGHVVGPRHAPRGGPGGRNRAGPTEKLLQYRVRI